MAAEPSSTSRNRRPRRPSLSNDELLAAAFDLFVEHGFEGTSIDMITASAGMAKRTVYLRYGDKESLFKAAIQRAIDLWVVPVDRLRDAETSDLEESLIAIGQLLVANVLSPAGLRLLQLTNAVSRRMPEIGAHNVRQGTGPTIDYLADFLRRRMVMPLRHFADATEAARAFINLVVTGPGSMVAWGVLLDAATIDPHIQSSVRLFLHGLLPAGEGLAGLTEENRRLKRTLADMAGHLDSIRALVQAGGD